MRRRRLLTAWLGVASGLGAVLLAWGATASLADTPAPTFSVLNATVNAAADHVVAGSSAFPNFNNGAINSYIPLAHAHVDSSPFSEGTASPADTGPLGQTGASQGGVNQPQYADDKYPPGNAGGVASTVGSQPGPFASALASSGTASAQASEAGEALPQSPAAPAPAAAGVASGAATPVSTDRWAGLWQALGNWRRTYLSADAAARFPAAHQTSAASDGVEGISSSSAVAFDPTTGILTSNGEASVAQASFGSGAVTIAAVHVSVAITNSGSPTQSVVDDVASVDVDGVPVEVGQNGVMVNGQQVPGVAAQLQSVDASLNAALATAGISMSQLAPVVTQSSNELTIDATGIEVTVVQPSTAPGVPQQNIRHVLGEVYDDSLAVPGTPTGVTSAGSGNGLGTGLLFDNGSGTGPGTVSVGVQPLSTGPTASPSASPSPQASAAPATTLVGLAAHKPLWLVLLYLLWQLLVLGTLASLWLWRVAPATATSST